MAAGVPSKLETVRIVARENRRLCGVTANLNRACWRKSAYGDSLFICLSLRVSCG